MTCWRQSAAAARPGSPKASAASVTARIRNAGTRKRAGRTAIQKRYPRRQTENTRRVGRSGSGRNVVVRPGWAVRRVAAAEVAEPARREERERHQGEYEK